MREFISELRRRNVLRVITAYALATWIIIEAGSVLLPTFGATTGTFQVYVIVALIGFVVAVTAWIFEITPQGIQFDKSVQKTPEQTLKSRRKMNYLIIGLLVVALSVSITFNVVDFEEPAMLPSYAPITRNSIAVLPFTSRSSDPENALFADGIHDDLLTMLANTDGLKVISRTSVMEYRDTNKNLRTIGEELQVDTLLEGAVQKVADNVRINVQLIDAYTDEHLWARTYDRQLSMQNIFSIQSEIAAAITNALQARLRVDQEKRQTAELPTESLRAYSLYTSGRDNLYLRRLETLQQARNQFERAVQLDPDYAEAHVGLAESVLLLYINHMAVSREEAYELTQRSLDTALELDPDLADAYATLGLFKTSVWAKLHDEEAKREAEAAFERALLLNPNHARAYMWFASLRDAEQRLEESIAFYHRSLRLDPLARIPLSNLPTLYAQMGQNDIALKLWLDAIEIHPEWPTPYHYIAVHLLGMGRLDEALAWHKKARSLSADEAMGGNIAIDVYLQFGDVARARQALEEIPADSPIAAYVPGLHQLLNDNFEAGLQVFAQLIDSGEAVPAFAPDVGVDLAILAGDLERAERYLLMLEPRLADQEFPVDRRTVRNVVKLAYLEKQKGNQVYSDQLLHRALEVVRTMPRLGMFGYGILDAQIYALLDRDEEALVALTQAVDSGYRGGVYLDNWLLPDDPFLESISGDTRFEAVLQRIATLNESMRARVTEAEQSGDWDQLMAKAGDTIYGARP